MHHFYLQHPPSHKWFDPWDVKHLLSLLESWAPMSSLTTFKLAWKTGRHIAWHCPSIRCFECDMYGHIVMDCPHRIPPSGTPVKHHWPKPHRSYHARSSSRHHHEDRDGQSCSRSQSHFHRHHSSSHHDSYRGHSRSWHQDNHSHPRSSSQCSHSTYRDYSHQSRHHTDLITDHQCMEVPQLTTPEIAVDHAHEHPTNLQSEIHTGHIHIPADLEANHTSGRPWGWK